MVDDAGRISRRSLLLSAGGLGALAAVSGGGFDYELHRHPGLRAKVFGCGSTPPIPASTYRIINGTTNSRAMGREMPWQVALPAGHRSSGVPTPLVLVLTGASGTPASLSTAIGLPGFATAAGVPVAFACPGSGGTIYYHPRANGEDPLTWILEEFLPMTEKRFNVGGRTANRAVYGWSMGGFASLLFAAQQPRRFCAAVASSPAVYPSYHAAVTGHPETFDSEADWEKWGLWDHLSDLDGVPVMLDCGSSDGFDATTRRLLATIPGAVGGIGSGCHDQGFWRGQLSTQLPFLAKHLGA